MLTTSDLNAALEHAARRGILPVVWSSAEARETISRQLRAVSVFSARTANAAYLSELSSRVQRLLQGGYNNDLPQLRLELKQLLAQMGYTPETGFPGDAELGIPPAQPGSLQDLSSDRRLNLILETQSRLMQGAMRYAEETTPTRIAQFPCWELVRVLDRDVPRGSLTSGSAGWDKRWLTAGGPPPVFHGNAEARLIAPKGHPVWAGLGDSALYPDALDVNHPPFAFRSGMGLREVHWQEVQQLGLPYADQPPAQARLPGAKASIKTLDPAVREKLKAELEARIKARQDQYGSMVLPGIAAAEALPPRTASSVLDQVLALEQQRAALSAKKVKRLGARIRPGSTPEQQASALRSEQRADSALQAVIEQARIWCEIPAASRARLSWQDTQNMADMPKLEAGARIAARYTAPELLPRQLRAIPQASGKRASYQQGKVFYSEQDGPSVIAHEITHATEQLTPALLQAARDFLLLRAKGAAPRKLNELDKTQQYRDNEWAYEDDWIAKGADSHYCGKLAPDHTELLTVGIERLHKDPILFASSDPEYFLFVLRSLQALQP